MYSFKITLQKVLKQLVIAGLAVLISGLIAEYPQIANFNVFGGLTTIALLNGLIDYLKHRWGLNIQ